jgi:hypothetical protein
MALFRSANVLRFARLGHCALRDNAAHEFAARHALCHYPSGVIYSFIPKNGCTTLRYTLALGNGCILGPEDFNWIHQNNWTFSASLSELVSAPGSFVVLRCPYARLASFYLDKVVHKAQPAPHLLGLAPGLVDLNTLTFRQFAKAMEVPAVRKANNHWRDQGDFLVFERYSAYFQLEEFGEAAAGIQRLTGMSLQDARGLSRHGLDVFTPDEQGNYCDTPAAEIGRGMAEGTAPARQTLFDDDIVTTVRRAYQDDIALYTELFGAKRLMFA